LKPERILLLTASVLTGNAKIADLLRQVPGEFSAPFRSLSVPEAEREAAE